MVAGGEVLTELALEQHEHGDRDEGDEGDHPHELQHVIPQRRGGRREDDVAVAVLREEEPARHEDPDERHRSDVAAQAKQRVEE